MARLRQQAAGEQAVFQHVVGLKLLPLDADLDPLPAQTLFRAEGDRRAGERYGGGPQLVRTQGSGKDDEAYLI